MLNLVLWINIENDHLNITTHKEDNNAAVSRKGDSLSTGHICAGTTILDTPGQSTVFANSILIARQSDKNGITSFSTITYLCASRCKC